MPLRINHNPAVINAHRNLVQNQNNLMRSLEKLSSGMKVNRASDGAAAMIISEQMRAQISGVRQAIDNSETAIGMVQTAEGALSEVTGLLRRIRQLAVHAANEGANDDVMLRADQFEIENALETIDRMTFNTQFGLKKILDGSRGANGVAIGDNLEFVEASPNTRASPQKGYAVEVSQHATRAYIQGDSALTEDMINKGEILTIAENGRTVSFKTTRGDSVAQSLGKFRNEIMKSGLQVNMRVDEDGVIRLEHKQHGKAHTFSVSSSTAGVLSNRGGELQNAVKGRDIQGSIGGQIAFGQGQLLKGGEGTPVEGLTVRYMGRKSSGSDDPADGEEVGRIGLYQNSLIFQVGGNVGQTVSVSLDSTNTRTLGRGIENASGFRSLRDVNVTTAARAQDTQVLVDRAIDEITTTRAQMGAFQKNSLESNLNQLRITAENLISAESTIRDADMASEIAEFTRNTILVESTTAMLAHANQLPRSVLTLLG